MFIYNFIGLLLHALYCFKTLIHVQCAWTQELGVLLMTALLFLRVHFGFWLSCICCSISSFILILFYDLLESCYLRFTFAFPKEIFAKIDFTLLVFIRSLYCFLFSSWASLKQIFWLNFTRYHFFISWLTNCTVQLLFQQALDFLIDQLCKFQRHTPKRHYLKMLL